MIRKSQWSLLDIENIITYDYYAFSFNPKQQYDDLKSGQYINRHINVITYIAKLFEYGKSYFDYLIFPESKAGRIHFHGYIHIKKPLQFDIFVIPKWKEVGSFEIDSINNPYVWYDYCRKQQDLWLDYKKDDDKTITFLRRVINKDSVELFNKNKFNNLSNNK